MKDDLAIARGVKLRKVVELAKERLGIEADDLEPYGHYKAKLSDALISKVQSRPDGKLILVTAISPTPAGEGKTTTTVGLGDAPRESLHDGRLADPRLADEDGVVLRAARQHLDDATNLLVATDDRVDLAVTCALCEVLAVLLERGEL